MFFNEFLMLLKMIKSDFSGEKLNFTTFINTALFNNEFRLKMNYRIGHYLIGSKILFIHLFADYLKYRQLKKFNCQIGYYSSIGYNLVLPHPVGIVIGQGVKISDNVTIFQNVTLGKHGNINGIEGYPKINDGVIIYAGSVVIGNITIGANSIIGANSFVNKDVPPNSVFAGQPAKFIRNAN